jgi:hypothetical protein
VRSRLSIGTRILIFVVVAGIGLLFMKVNEIDSTGYLSFGLWVVVMSAFMYPFVYAYRVKKKESRDE